MAVRFVCLCEICLDEEREVSAKPMYLKVGDTGGLIDLCDTHTELIFAPLIALVRNHSRPEGGDDVKPAKRPMVAGPAVRVPAVSKRPGDTWPCPACPERLPFGSGTGLNYHAHMVHGVTPAQINAVASDRCRMPDCDWVNTTTGGPYPLTSHLRNVHKIPNIVTMTARVAATDPELVEDLMELWYRSAVAAI